MLPLATVLHPTDFSQNSEFAFRVACSLARDYNARLILLHVIPPPMVIYAGGPVPAETWPNPEEVKEKLQQLEGRVHKVRVESQVLEGDPVDMIVRAAEESGSDVIVMGTHGRIGHSQGALSCVERQAHAGTSESRGRERSDRGSRSGRPCVVAAGRNPNPAYRKRLFFEVRSPC